MKNLDIHEGMRVYANTGEFIGRVSALGESHFEVERGYLVSHDFDVEDAYVDEIDGGRILLNKGRGELHEIRPQSGGAVSPLDGDLTAEHTQG